ncbi:sensor histidine kinase [Actinophytocola algeriensis]|uniref:histidine kinase n=1 Tax=Actinophytocola algeriensis TaxID=1768010 RepID=A0A7W7VFZ0_9PSEU|nr:histidine kinase [Actinophytocola algeriensis]MBB4908821.1 signal transduction histidine kinase [Actinophytocola algeriensis]MBE1474792.1 signal transduction histidine kinase [Actinophytocola algeriensis]
MSTAGPPARRGVFVAEVAVLVAASVLDAVLALRTERTGGFAGPLLSAVLPYLGTAFAVLAVLRRRLPDRIGRLAAVVVGLSLVGTAARAAANWAGLPPGDLSVVTEVLAVVVLVGAGCRRLPVANAVVLTAAGGAAVVLAPVVRYGIGSTAALLAAPAALLWGVALAVGLVLRDADTRHTRVLREARMHDRLRMARELHDLVAHYLSGIVVRAQAARSLAGNPAVPPQDPVEVYREIEETGAEGLAAMRKLVGMLRDDEHQMPLPGTDLGAVVRSVVDGRGAVRVALPGDLDDLPVSPEVAAVLHRVLLESLTNVRRHARRATDVRVTLRVAGGDLELDVGNDLPEGAVADGEPGYGIIGMTERVAALGGTLTAGPRDGRWHTTARLPLARVNEPTRGV